MLIYTLEEYIKRYTNPLPIGTMLITTEGSMQYIAHLVNVAGKYRIIAISDGFVYKPVYDNPPTIIDIKKDFEEHGYSIELITKGDMCVELLDFLKSKDVI